MFEMGEQLYLFWYLRGSTQLPLPLSIPLGSAQVLRQRVWEKVMGYFWLKMKRKKGPPEKAPLY